MTMNRAFPYKLFLTLLLCLLPLSGRCGEAGENGARAAGLHPRLEWGIGETFYRYHSYNFDSQEGYRIRGEFKGADFFTIAEVYAGVDWVMGKHFSTSATAGLCGLYRHSRCIPVNIRINYYTSSFYNDSAVVFLQAGTGIKTRASVQKNALFLVAAGGGYHFSLTRSGTALDLLLRVQGSSDHPDLVNPESSGTVEKRNIRKNDAYYCALNFSIALSF